MSAEIVLAKIDGRRAALNAYKTFSRRMPLGQVRNEFHGRSDISTKVIDVPKGGLIIQHNIRGFPSERTQYDSEGRVIAHSTANANGVWLNHRSDVQFTENGFPLRAVIFNQGRLEERTFEYGKYSKGRPALTKEFVQSVDIDEKGERIPTVKESEQIIIYDESLYFNLKLQPSQEIP